MVATPNLFSNPFSFPICLPVAIPVATRSGGEEECKRTMHLNGSRVVRLNAFWSQGLTYQMLNNVEGDITNVNWQRGSEGANVK